MTWTDIPGLDFQKFSIVSGLRNHDYVNDSHIPNGVNLYMACEVENNKLPLVLSSSDHITRLGIEARSLVL